VSLVRIADKSSFSCCVTVEVQKMPLDGVIDTGADVTIMGARK